VTSRYGDDEERRGRGRPALVIGVVLALAAAAVALSVTRPWARSGAAPAATGTPKPTVAVARETLVDETSVPGRLDYEAERPLAVPGIGMITWIAPEGGTVGRGEPLLRVNEAPVAALFGPVPMFRPLAVDAVGRDVHQLESNLRQLGYDGFTVDQEFTEKTAEAVKRWQISLGMPGTGLVQPGQIVFVPGAIRVTRHLLRPGGMLAGADVLSYTTQAKSVTVRAAVDKADWAKAGRAVTVRLPDGKNVAGTVAKVSTEVAAGPTPAVADPAQPTTSRVQIALTEPDAVRAYPPGPVDVRYVARERKDVLAVPVAALLALAEGGYGVEVVDAGGARIVPVEVGMFADALVEVSGPGLDDGVLVSVAP